MLSCDNACNLKHVIHLDYRKTFLQRNSSICGTKCCRWGSRANQLRETFARRPPTMSLNSCGYSTEFYGWATKTADIGTSIWQIPTPQSFLLIRFRNQEPACSDFPSEAMLWIKEVEMVDSMAELKSSRSIAGNNFQNFEMLDAKIALPLLWTRSSRTPTLRRRSVSRNRKPRKRTGFFEEDRSPSWSMTTFVLLVLMIQFLITLIYSLSLFATTMFRTSTRGGMIFQCPWPRSHLMTSWIVCTNWEYVNLTKSKPS